jgi:hypothetical protein
VAGPGRFPPGKPEKEGPVRKLLRSRVALIAAFVVIVLTTAVLLTVSKEAQAASNCTYYSNASYTTVVGQFGYDCCNNYVAWGKKTAYKICGGCFICFPPPR